jgi:hypothetical protein
MASTLDSVITQINTDLKASAARAVHKTVVDIVSGRSVDPNLVTDITNSVLNRAVGGIFNQSVHTVNSTIAKALGNKFKHSALNVIAGNYVSSVLTQVITGKQTANMSVQMTNAISQGISQELFARLPKSLTKNVNINILGTSFNTGLSPIISKAINSTVGAVVNSAVGISSAATASIPGITNIPTLQTTSVVPDFGKLTSDITGGITSTLSNSFASITGTLSGMVDSLGDSVNTIISSVSALGNKLNITEMKLPEGLDMTRFTSGGDSIGKLIELSSSAIGSASKMPGLSKTQFSNIQQQLASSNINNPLNSLGGQFAGLASVITGTTTTSGVRSITKDLTTKFADINTAFGVLSQQEKQSIEKVKQTTIDMSKTTAKQASTQAASFKTMSNDQLEKLTNIKEGFKDPNAKYPLPEYQNRTETNKLSTGDTDNTIVDKKNYERMLGAQLPNGGSWDQPVSPYGAQYPYNHVRETESGHVIELDDTPGAERIHMFHKSGTFVEVDSNGNKVQVIKGSDYTIIDRNGYISIQGKANVSVTGSINLYVGGDANVEVNGNTFVNCHNNMELNAAGRLKLTAGEGIDIKSPEVYIDADTTLQVNAGVSAKLHVKEFNLIVDTDMKVDVFNDHRLTVVGNSDTKISGTTKHHSVGDYNVNSNAAINQTVATDYSLSVTGNIKQSSGAATYSDAGGTYNITAGDIAAIDAVEIHWNSGKAEKSEPTKSAIAINAEALETEYCDANYISGRKSISETVHSDTFSPPKTANGVTKVVMDSILAGNTEMTDRDAAVLIEDHGVDSKVINQDAIVLDTAEKVVSDVTVIVPSELPLGDLTVPSNWKLSPNFTIADLSTNTAYPYSVESMGSVMTTSKIVANLQYIALNVLEPIYAVRPDMTVQLGFMSHDPNADTRYVRHNFGLSVSLDFTKADSFDDYFDITNVIRAIVPFDEITLMCFSKEMLKTTKSMAVVVIDVPGVFYPNITSVNDAVILEKWVNANNKKNLKTIYNGKVVSKDNIVLVA